MKLRRFLTVLMFSVLAFSGLMFGCKDKYKDFRIEINSGSSVTLYSSENSSVDNPNYTEVQVEIVNAPNENCKNISYETRPNNIVSVEQVSLKDNIATFLVTALDNITAQNPSCVVEFYALKGTKHERKCEVKINVEIPISSLNANKDQKSYVVADGEPYYINTSNALIFYPNNTTQRDVEYSLVKDVAGVSLTENGEIKVDEEEYFGAENVSSKIKVKVQSKSVETLSCEIDVYVLREIKNSDLTLSYVLNGESYSFKGDFDEDEKQAISVLESEGITLASNLESNKNANFSVGIDKAFGWDFEDISVEIENSVMENALIQSNEIYNTNNLKNFVIFSTNSGKESFIVKIKYRNVEEYEREFIIPVKTLEYPISLVVNNSLAKEYNLFDYYKNSSFGETFDVKISDVGAFDKKFKIFVSEEDFDKIEIRFDGELLSYDDLLSRVFDGGSQLLIRAKEIKNANDSVNVLFYSNILSGKLDENIDLSNPDGNIFANELENDNLYKNLFKNITLNLVAGVRSLSFKDVLDVVYLEKSKQQIDVNFVVNNGLNTLDEYVDFEFVSGSFLVDVTREIGSSRFTIKSKNLTGTVEFFLKSQNDVVTEHKTIVIYSAYNENDDAKFDFDLSSAFIKKVASTDVDGKENVKYFIGTSYGKNSANFKVLNPQNATIFGVSAKTNKDFVKVNVLNSDELLFNLFATENINDVVTVEVKLLVFVFDENENEYVQKEVSVSFEISTYEPLSTILFENGKSTMQIEVVDGDGLDKDSLENNLNVVDINDFVLINGQKNNTRNIEKIEYSYPQYLIEGTNSDYEILNQNAGENDEQASETKLSFDKIAFHVYRNHQDKFVDGKFVVPISILISDLEGTNEKYLLSLTVVVKTQIKPESVKINNENGFVYMENSGLGIGQINAEVKGENKKEATNKNLYFELISGSSVSVDSSTGVVSMKSAGVSKVRVYAKGSKYGSGANYSIFKDVYVVVADGSESYPYILNDAGDLKANKYYTLNKNLVVNNTISTQPAGIDGKFAYAEFANNSFDENAIYSIMFNGKNQSVFGETLNAKLKNLNVYYNQNTISLTGNFGLIATINNENNVIENLSLFVNNIQINNEKDNSFVGLMFATNYGEILNCDILNAENQKTMVVLGGKSVNFGGICAINEGKILSSFDFVKSNNHQMLSIKIVDLSSSNENSVGGVVAINEGLLSGIKIEADIETNAKFVGGIAGKIESKNVEYKNLYFAGNINATNNDSVVGGIAGNVESEVEDETNENKTTFRTDFSLIFVEFLGNVDKNEASISGNIVGGLFGNASFKAVDTEGKDVVNNRTNVKYAYSENFALLNENAVNVKGNVAGGLVGKLASNAKLEAVFSDVKIFVNENVGNSTNVGGAFVGETTNSLTVESAYSYSTGVINLVGKVNDASDLKLLKVYSTTNAQKDNDGNDYYGNESKYFFDKDNYYSNIFTITDNSGNFVFRTGNFAYLSTKNGGLPYIVYNENDGYKQLYTIVATSLDAKFVVKNEVENSQNNYVYGNNENIIVVKDNDLDKAVIYFKNNLQFDILEILNINSTPVDASKSYNFESSDSSVLAVSPDGTIVVKAVGNATIMISAKHNTNVKTYVFVSVVEKIEEIFVDENIVVNKGETKQIDAEIENKNINNGLMFELSEDVSSKVLINNKQSENGKIFNVDSSTFIYGRENFESIIKVYGFTKVKFDGIDYNFVHFDTKKTINLSVVEFARMISPSVSYFEVTENESVEFEVYVDSKASEQNLEFSLQSGENFNEFFEILKCEKDSSYDSENLTKFNIILKAKNVNLEDDKYFKIVIKQINGILNENISASIDVVIKTTKLQSVELNHYSSTVTYYNSYDYIINKETIPSFEITKGNFGVLTINLFPSFANITSVEVTSSIENGNRIGFSQLKLNDNNKLVVCANKGYLGTGIKLDVDKDELLNNGGNLFVSTLLSTVVSENTIFTITVTCFYGVNQKISSTINLNTKALTTIMLSNSNGSDKFYAPKGGVLELDVSAINMNEDFELGLENFEFKIEGRELDSCGISDKNGFKFLIDNASENGTNSIFGYKIDNENNKLYILSDIMNKSGIELKVTPKFKMIVNDKFVESEGAEVTIEVVDFVVSGVNVVDAENGILKNYVGNSTILKANLITNSCENAYYYNADGEQIEKIGDISVNENARALELSNIKIKIKALEEQISTSNFTWNVITKNSSGNKVYNNIKENTNYSNFVVKINEDGYFVVSGTKVSQSEMILKTNLSYKNGHVSIDQSANNELLTEFVLNVTTFASLDHPEPIKTVEEFENMSDDGDYILMNDITLPSNFEGISAKISSFDGNNKTIFIQGFNINSTNLTSVGLFREIDEKTIIKNVFVNILPTFFEDDDGYYYGLNINAQNLSSLNFGVLCGTNNGVITNCHVQNDNYKLVNGKNVYQDVAVNVYCKEEIDVNVGGLVGENNGYITNSSFGNVYETFAENIITIRAKAQIGGFVGKNNNKIASSYVVNAKIYNNSLSKLTAGFVAVNGDDALISTSYVQGYSENSERAQAKILNESDEDIFANGYVGGFVATNDGNVKDCYSNVCINTNKRSSGFVYDNTNGYVETSISASTVSKSSQSFRYFTGNDEENLTLNNNGIKYCYYLLPDGNRDGAEGEYDEPANGIASLDEAGYFEGFICDGTESGVWKFEKGIIPRLVDADRKIESERVLVDEKIDASSVQQYNYRYINNNIGTYNNPIIVRTSEEFFNALTNESNLFEYYYNGKVNKTKINYKNISVVKDLDLSKIIDKNNVEQNSASEVQKLQDIIFAGELNVNNMLLENLTITAKNDKVKYSSFGLFKQIGVSDVYDNGLNINNEYLDEDNCSVIKNASIEIDGISATITKVVGSLSGEVVNSKLYNINVYSDNNVVVTGGNIVGGVAGRISGNSFVKGVSSNLSVMATHENKTNDYNYEFETTKKVYKYAFDVIEDEKNLEANIVGGIFGVVDIYKTQLNSRIQKSGKNSNYIEGEIVREYETDFINAPVQFTKVSGDIRISGDIVGGMFGYVSEGTTIYDARFELNESNTQNLISNYAVGGIIGINKGFATYLTVETKLSRQREIDKTNNDGYLTSYLFSNENNKATFVGGLVGILKNGMLTNSYNKANIGAKNSRFVGSSVGAMENGRIEYVYANSFVEAQSEINENGLITRQKGYAGFVGTIVAFDENSSINYAVSILRNKKETDKFGLAGMIGYNQVKNISSGKIRGEIDGENNNFNIVNGFNIENIEDYIYSYSYENYISQISGTFNGFQDSDCFVRTLGLDTFWRLTYNKKGAVREISSEDDLYNILTNGDCVLTSDIYLTKPWRPVSSFKGSFYSEPRRNKQVGQSEYYCVYNLTINEDSSNISNNVGFFISTENATISNITFVVGSNYVDPTPNVDPSVDTNPDPTERDNNWGNGTKRGINIINTSVEEDYALGVLSAIDKNSSFTNITIKFDDATNNSLSNGGTNYIVSTSLNKVGTLIGKATGSKVKGVSIENLKLKREAKKSHNAYVGGLVGYALGGEYENIAFKGATEIYNLQSKENKFSYIGGLFGEVSSDCKISKVYDKECEKFKITHNADGTPLSSGESRIYAGSVAGSASTSTIENVVLNHAELKVENKYDHIKEMFVGGVCGFSKGGSINQISLSSSTKIEVQNVKNVDLSDYVGGVCGYGESVSIQTIISALTINYQDVSSQGNAFIGGIVGKNGEIKNGGIKNGSIIDFVLAKNKITIKDKKQNVFAGGIVGFNVSDNANVSNTLFAGFVKFFGTAISNVGGTAGVNTKFSQKTNDNNIKNFTNSFFIEDLSLTPSRNEEFGTAVKYGDFVNNINKTDCEYSYASFLTRIENSLGIETKNFVINNDEDCVVSGSAFDFDSGSVFNPIKINEFDKLLNSNDNNYYLITSDLSSNSSNSINTVKGIIIGDGHTISLSTTFAKEIDENAIISGVIFNLESNNNDEFNGNKFVKDVQTIVANTNSGVIYNTAVKGNMSVENKQVAPVVLKNSGIINVVTSLSHIVAKEMIVDEAYASGFVVENNGAVYNSISTGNLEFIKENYNVLTLDTNITSKFYGFVQANSDIIVNCVSGTSLPIKDANVKDIPTNTSFGGSSSTTTFVNCFVDITSNGYYSGTNTNGVIYETFDEIFNIGTANYITVNGEVGKTIQNTNYITNDSNGANKFSGLWSENNEEILFGYAYPIISTYKNIEENKNVNVETFENRIKDALKTTETNGNETTYLINNLSSYKFVLERLNTETENGTQTTQNASNETIKIKLIASFMGGVSYKKENSNNSLNNKIQIQTLKLNKNLEFDGNNFVIYGLNLSSIESNDKNDSYTGLFYSDDNSITIKNLALVDAIINVCYVKNKNENGVYHVYNNIYAGTFVAYSNAKVEISGSYASGTIQTSTVNLDNLRNPSFSFKNAKNLYAGGLVGYATNATISNNLCEIDITLDDIDATISVTTRGDDNSITKQGYDAYVGGIVGQIKNATISNNYNLGNIYCSSVKSLYKGGIAGKLDAGTLKGNANFGAVSYKGAYLAYYASSSDTSKLYYNVNAILGSKGDGTINNLSTNNYNSALNLATDKFVSSETSLADLIALLSSEKLQSRFKDSNNNLLNKFVYNPKKKTITKTTEKIDESTNETITEEIIETIIYSETQIFEPSIVTIEDEDVKIETITDETTGETSTKKFVEFANNTFYIVSTTKDFEFRVIYEKDEIKNEKSLENTKILFTENHTTTISENIFDSLENCVISNLTIQSSSGLTTSALAKQIVNTTLYNINVQNVYFNRTTGTLDTSEVICVGGVVDIAENSIFENVKVDFGRVNALVTGQSYVGAIAGYASASLFNNCENSATVTVTGADLYVAGIVGSSKFGYFFHCKNNGLVYAKNTSSNNGDVQTAGIVNANGDYISFCENKQNIKGINNSIKSESLNYVSGIANGGVILYSTNRANSIAISGSMNGKTIANGIGGLRVYYSYHFGAVMSTSDIFTLTGDSQGEAYYSYSLGSGFTTRSQGDVLPALVQNRAQSMNTIFDADNILGTIQNDIDKGNTWLTSFINLMNNSGNFDFYITNATYTEEGKIDSVIENGNTKYSINLQSLAVIRFLDGTNGFALKTTEDDKTYQISNAFELWWWSYFGDKTKNVELLDDIDMTGYSYLTPNEKSPFKGTFEGNYHTISSLTINSLPNSNYWGLVGVNDGTIQNINFENPSVTITADKAFGADNYISIVAGQNNKTIKNIVVGQVSEAGSNINIQYSANEMVNTETYIYIGTIAGQSNSSSSIQNCYVINLSAPAISSKIINNANGGFGFTAQNIYALVGGIVGQVSTSASITGNSYVSALVSYVINNHSFGFQFGEDFSKTFLYPKYSFAYNYAGMIVGYVGKFNIEIKNNLFEIKFDTTNISNINSNYFIKSSNLYKTYTKNGEKTQDYGGYTDENENKSLSFWEANTHTIASQGKSGVLSGITRATKKLNKGVKLGKFTNVIGWIDMALEAEASLWNSQNFRTYFNTYGKATANPEFADNTYLSQYTTNFENSNIAEIFENKNADGSITYNIPLSQDFFKLSKTKTEPKNKVGGTYYVYNVNEFAYAVSQNSVKNIVLMDHIDMTKKVWDLTLQSGLTIIDNGFKIVYGSNNNFAKAWNDNKYKTILLAEKTSDVDDYGKFDTLTKDYTKTAYSVFEDRFKNAWAKGYKGEDDSRLDADAINKSQDIISTDTNGNPVYYIDYAEQLEVIADALYTYTIDGETYHKGINFYNRTFVLRKDLELPESLISLDVYNYNKKEKQNETEKETNEYSAPSFTGGSTIVFAEKYKTTFNGTFDGQNHSITINENQNLLDCLGKNGKITNIILNIKDISTLENITSLGVITNYGTISALEMKVPSNLTLSYNLNYIDFVSSIDNSIPKAISIVPITFGLLNETNYGTITGCIITNNNNSITITPTISVDYTNLSYTYETYDTNQNLETKTIDLGTYSLQTSLNLDIGLYCGNNYGKIENITVNNQTITINNLSISETFEKDAEKTITYNVLGNNGLISGSNIYDSNDSPEDAGIKDVNIINTTCNLPSSCNFTTSTISTISTTNIYNGAISGSSELDFENCRVIGLSVELKTNTTSVKTGALAGQISPSLFSQSVLVELDGGNLISSVQVDSAHIPQTTNCFATGLNFFGEYVKITIGKIQEIKDNKGNDIKVTYYYGDNEVSSEYLDYFYYTIPSSISSGVSENDDGSITLTSESGFVDTSKTSISIDLTDSTSMKEFGKTVITPNEITMKAYVEDKVVDGSGNTVTVPSVEWVDKIKVKLKLSLNNVQISETNANGNINSYNPYCFMQNGETVYVSNDLNNNIFTTNDNETDKIKLELVDDNENSCTNIAGKENVEILVDGTTFIAGNITFDASPTEVESTIKDKDGNDVMLYGYKIVITYQNLTTKIKMTTDQTLSQVKLPAGMSFVIPQGSDETTYLNENFNKDAAAGYYKINYSFKVNGIDYQLKNIAVIPTNNNGEPYSND